MKSKSNNKIKNEYELSPLLLPVSSPSSFPSPSSSSNLHGINLNPSYGDRYGSPDVAESTSASTSATIVTPIPQRGRSTINFVSKINHNTADGINHTNHYNVNANANVNNNQNNQNIQIQNYHLGQKKQQHLRPHLPKEYSPLGSPPMLMNIGGKDETNNTININSSVTTATAAAAVPSGNIISSNINNRIDSITPMKKRKISTMNNINESSSNQSNSRSLKKKKSSSTTIKKKQKQQQLKQKPKTIRQNHRGKKFSWKAYPELEDFLIKNRDEYLSFSAKNYTIEQRDYNNRLTSQCLEYSIQCGYSDLFQDSVFASVRDRIRSYYKSYVQSFKRRRERQQKQEQKTHQYEQQQEQQGQLPTINTTMVNNNNSSW